MTLVLGVVGMGYLMPITSQLNKEYVAMQREPPPFVWAAPDEKNILTCEYLHLFSRETCI